MQSWSDLCFVAESRSLQSLLEELLAVSGVTVSHSRCPSPPLPNYTLAAAIFLQFMRPQMLFFLVGAVAHAIAFVRWKTRSAEEKLKGWKHYGLFTAVSCLCCVSGMLAYAARTGNTALIYKSSSIGKQSNQTSSTKQEKNEVLRGMLQFSAAHWALLPLEIGLLINANLLIIQRLRRFSSSTSSQNRMWSLLGRVFFIVVNVGNVIGFCGNIAVSVYFHRASQLYDDAAKAWAGNNSTAGKDLERQAGAKTQEGVAIASVRAPRLPPLYFCNNLSRYSDSVRSSPCWLPSCSSSLLVLAARALLQQQFVLCLLSSRS